jgi:Fe-S-cluster containining protein
MVEPEPWYKNGLQFTCTQCGACCTGAPGVVWVTDEELQQIADILGKTIGEVRLLHTRKFGRRTSLTEFANGDCTFFDGRTRRCTIYEARPIQCRTWPFWNSNLESPETWAETQQSCPGAGHGIFFSLEEIEASAAKLDI